MKHLLLPNLFLCAVCLVLGAAPAWSQQPDTPAGAAPSAGSGLPQGYRGPAAPVPPEVIARDGALVTIRATQVSTPFRVDGRLDEVAYGTTKSMTDFIQNDPRPGQPATEKTEVWLFYDRQNVYVMARLWESEPGSIMATEMRRDASVFNDDNFAWSFDTFYDRRNGFVFEVSASGGWLDGQVSNERSLNRDFNPVWGVKVGRFEGGWTLESAIPFKSLRYKPGQSQVWGFQARRFNRKKNEVSFLTPLSAAHGRAGHFRSSLSATVVGLQSPSGSRTLEIKPYVTGSVSSDISAQPKALSNDPSGNAGLDVKYAITQNLTSDFTYRTDFAQVEADEQQVNLTRFNLAFPEKRDFFLENSGVFTFGQSGATNNQGSGPAPPNDVPQMFYSRSIGLNAGRQIPMDAGARTTGRVGKYSVGGIYVRTAEEDVSASPANNFSVLRLRRDLFRRSSVGALFTNRSVGVKENGSNQAYGLDTLIAFSDVFAINAYWAKTETPLRSNPSQSYRAQLDYNSDRYGIQIERLSIDQDFNPEIGFVRRADMRKNFGEFRFSPRLRTSKTIRRIFFTNGVTQVQNHTGRTESRLWEGEFAIDLMNSDRVAFQRSAQYEYLPSDFKIATGITLPKGSSYDFGENLFQYNFGRQRAISGNVTVTQGSFYDGHRVSLTVAQGRVNVTSKFSLEPTYTLNKVDLREGDFTSHLLGSRINYTTSPMMFTSALVQFNSDTKTVSANVRLRWQYEPGSEFFIVYNEQRDTSLSGFPGMQNRALIFKINKFIRP